MGRPLGLNLTHVKSGCYRIETVSLHSQTAAHTFTRDASSYRRFPCGVTALAPPGVAAPPDVAPGSSSSSYGP
jgi:hypothetical protein